MTVPRRVDWSKLPEDVALRPRVLEGSTPSDLASLLVAFHEMTACDHTDAILRCAHAAARQRIGLTRVSFFLRDEASGLMRGTWGTDIEGARVDEHFISFELWEGEREAQDRALENGVHWTVVENAPLVVHLATESRVVGRGWVCCTPIRTAFEPIGMMFNDAGLTGASVDDAQQARGAVLCSLLGMALDLARRRGHSLHDVSDAPRSPAVAKAAAWLVSNPSLTAEELGARLGLSASRMARVFKSELGVSLVEYRNRLRVERFSTLLDQNGDNLLEAALAAGFGSYAQFHRVFSALRGTTPGKFLRSRAPRQK